MSGLTKEVRSLADVSCAARATDLKEAISKSKSDMSKARVLFEMQAMQRSLQTSAKKKKKKSGKQQQKQSEIEEVLQQSNNLGEAQEHPPNNTETKLHSIVLLTSYTRKSDGMRLVDAQSAEIQQAADLLYDAPVAVLSHLADEEEDPADGTVHEVTRMTYGNLAAQAVFNYSWQQLIGMDSTFTAPADDARDNRARDLSSACNHGFATLSGGYRITSDGFRFKLGNTHVWVVDAPEEGDGLAAAFDTVELVDDVPEDAHNVFAGAKQGEVFVASSGGKWIKREAESSRDAWATFEDGITPNDSAEEGEQQVWA